MKKILEVAKRVEMILQEKPETRDDDNLLWLEAVRETVRDWETGNKMCELTFAYVLKNIRSLGLPSFETVSRARRKIQAKHPALRGSERAAKGRAKKEKVYKEFARL